jgi:NADPH:quinone reductase-like Zn-dependent oxidoreductase
MNAVVLTGYGEVDKLELRDLPDPKPRAGEVKVQVAAASINPVDWKIRSGAMKAMMPVELPAVLGRDVSGTVLEVGPGVKDLARGDKVLGLVRQGYAEQVVAAQDAFARIPDGLDLRAAAALPLVGLTGAQLIEEATRPRPGERVLITGAVGGVGRAAVFAAKQLGARVIAGVRGKQKAEAQELGAEQVVAIDDDAEIAKLPQLDAIADTVSGDTIAKLIPKIRKGGSLGSVLGEPPAAKGRDLRVHAFMAHPDPRRLRELAEAASRGELEIPVEKTFPLAQAGEAQKLAERGGVGKVLLIV